MNTAGTQSIILVFDVKGKDPNEVSQELAGQLRVQGFEKVLDPPQPGIKEIWKKGSRTNPPRIYMFILEGIEDRNTGQIVKSGTTIRAIVAQNM